MVSFVTSSGNSNTQALTGQIALITMDMPSEELEKRNENLTSRTSPVREDYAIEHGTLLAHGQEVSRYDPLDHREVVAEFAKLHEGDERKLLEFARRWGRLGWDFHDPDVPPPGEPLSWIWQHAANVRLVLQLHHYRQRADYDGLRQFLDSLTKAAPSFAELGPLIGPMPLIAPIADPLGPSITEVFVPLREGDPESVAEGLIRDLINPGLQKLHHELYAGLQLGPSHPSLLVAIYWHLANIVAQHSLKRCEECGELFVVTDGRQKYCPLPAGLKGTTGSQCGARARKRRLRQQEGG